MDLFELNKQRIARNLQDSYTDFDIEKGKKANIGEIRKWKGKKYQKQGNGNWMEMKDGAKGSSKEEGQKAKPKSTEKGKSDSKSFEISKKEKDKFLEMMNRRIDDPEDSYVHDKIESMIVHLAKKAGMSPKEAESTSWMEDEMFGGGDKDVTAKESFKHLITMLDDI